MAYLSDIFKGNESGLHVGTLATFLKDKVPAGYLIPNGAEFSSLEYPELFTYLGSNKLPDLIDDDLVPVGSIMPWMSDSDIPDGWHHLGAQGGTNEISSGQRKYDPEQYPEFCKFLQTVRGDNYLRVMRFGEVLRQVVKETPQGELNTPDVTDAWGWQNDAIRPVTGSIVAFSGIGGVAEPLHPDGVFRSKPTGTNRLLTTASTGTESTSYGLAFDISNVHPVAKDVRMTNRSVNYLIKVKPSKITKTTIAIKAAGRVSDEGLMQVEGIRKELDTFSHPNLLINGDFSVNQRGHFGSLSTATELYIDRWYSRGLGTNVTLKQIKDEKSSWLRTEMLNDSQDYMSHWQFIEQPDHEIYAATFGKDVPVTCSFVTRTAVVDQKGQVFLRWRNITDKNEVVSDFTAVDFVWGNDTSHEITMPVPEITGFDVTKEYALDFYLSIGEIISGTVKQGIYDLSQVKLELGSKATPFVADDPATNLAKCQRYYQKGIIRGFNTNTSITDINGKFCGGYTKLPVPMRTKGTLQFGSGVNVMDSKIIVANGVQSISAGSVAYDETMIFIDAIIMESGAGTWCQIFYRKDSEL